MLFSEQPPIPNQMFRNYFKLFPKFSDSIKHYFFEFILLFFAIFLGFLTENYRDGRVKQDQVHQYLSGIIQDVRLDQELSAKVIADYEMRITYFDTLRNSFIEIVDGDYWRFAQLSDKTSAYEDFYPTLSSYRQLQSGGFSLIRDMSLL